MPFRRYSSKGPIMPFLPEVIQAEFVRGHCIRLWFNDGTDKLVDFSCWLNGPIFKPLNDGSYFKRFFLDGGTVVWPNGADIAPEALYDAPAVEEKNGRRPRKQLQRA
jgi:hypothetical protein